MTNVAIVVICLITLGCALGLQSLSLRKEKRRD